MNTSIRTLPGPSAAVARQSASSDRRVVRAHIQTMPADGRPGIGTARLASFVPDREDGPDPGLPFLARDLPVGHEDTVAAKGLGDTSQLDGPAPDRPSCVWIEAEPPRSHIFRTQSLSIGTVARAPVRFPGREAPDG